MQDALEEPFLVSIVYPNGLGFRVWGLGLKVSIGPLIPTTVTDVFAV